MLYTAGLCLSHMLNQNSRTTPSTYVLSELSQFYFLPLLSFQLGVCQHFTYPTYTSYLLALAIAYHSAPRARYGPGALSSLTEENVMSSRG